MEKTKNGKQFFTIFITIFLDMVGVGLIIPILAPMLLGNDSGLFSPDTELRTRTIVFGLLMASYSLSQFISSPIIGALSDIFGRRKVIIISLISTIGGYILFTAGIHFSSLLLLFIGRIIPGLASGNITIAYSAIADLSTPADKTKNFGLIGIAFGLGFVLGPFIGGHLSNQQLVHWFGFDTPFIAATLLSILNLLLVLKNFKETLTVRKQKRISLLMGFNNIIKALSLKSIRGIFIIILIYTFGFAFFTQFFIVLLVQKFGFRQEDIGMLYGYLGIWVAIAQGLILRRISKKIKPQKIAIYTIPMMAVALLTIMLPTTSIYLYLIIPFIAFAQSSSNTSLNAIVSNLAGKDIQGEMMGISLSMNFLAQSLPALIGGAAVAAYIYMPLVVGAFCSLLSWILYIGFYKMKLRQGLF